MPENILITTALEYQEAALLFKEYANWLAIDLSFQHFEKEMADIKQIYYPPTGGIILCHENDQFIGCVAIRAIDSNIAELKRMYVKQAFQGRKIGENLLQDAIRLARSYNYKKIRLDTLRNMTAAIALYKKHGFYEIPAYYHNPEKNAVYFEKDLGSF